MILKNLVIQQVADVLNFIGLEVESRKPIKDELSEFLIAKIIKVEKHPNADRLKICDVDIGNQNIQKLFVALQTLEMD